MPRSELEKLRNELELSTPSLGITQRPHQRGLRLELSTPSLGITKGYWACNSLSMLSTPSLGITAGFALGSSRLCESPFNSLSRDHKSCRHAPSHKHRKTFNSLSRDHEKTWCCCCA
jgi:hypothetical protein